MSFPIKNGDFPVRYVKLPEGIPIFGNNYMSHKKKNRMFIPP